MADRMERGFLLMSHTSSGRKPTPLAYRFFIQTLLQEDEIPVLQEVAIKQRMWPVRFEIMNNLLSKASRGEKEVSILMGDEIDIQGLDESAFVFSRYDTRGKGG